uniref:Maelstrom domain-containing protein n=1 Tax=Angiostrongylus cantonensis TaxID=6313 RepID=A0A0K0DIT6_ANGCA
MFHEGYGTKQSSLLAPSNLPLHSQTCAGYSPFRNDVYARNIEAKQDLLKRLTFLNAKNKDFSTVPLQFVTVFPYIVTPSSIGDLLVYPAEIAITDFTFADGPSSCWSALINFDPALFYDNIPLCDHKTVERNAALLDVPSKHSLGRNPRTIWKMLMKKCVPNGIIVCNADQMIIVDRALAFLASTVAPGELRLHEDIMSQMVTAQDLVAALDFHRSVVTNTPVTACLTAESIDEEFKKLREASKCCVYHESKPPSHDSRQHCAVAKAAVLIDAICSLCVRIDLFNFADFYDAEAYSMSNLYVESPDTEIGSTKSKHTDVSRDGLADSNHHTRENLQGNAFILRYKVVPPEEDPFLRRTEVKVDLKDAISRMARMCVNMD